MKNKDRSLIPALTITFFGMIVALNLAMRDAKFAFAWDLSAVGLGTLCLFLAAIVYMREIER